MQMKKPRLFFTTLTLVLTLAVTMGSAVAADQKTELFERVQAVYEVVNSWHKDGADLDAYTTGAIKGGLEALGDPYTNYYTNQEYGDFIESLNGSFGGIGAYLEQDGNYVVISSVIKGTPAMRAGLRSGDRILEANGTPLVGSTTEKAVKVVRGQPGTTVTLKIERPDSRATFTVTITRAQINVPEIESKMLEGQIGYVQITTFGDDSASSFHAAVKDLESQGAKGLILDVRQNGGGYLSAAVSIAGAFIPKGEAVVWEVGKSGKEATFSAGSYITLPTAVLVDNGTASASEVLAGALQDYGVAPLVGAKTFGKGTVQQILSLSHGGGIKVTVAEYLTPKERHVHGVGLTPDYAVEGPKPAGELLVPFELKRLILPGTVGVDVQQLQYRLNSIGYDADDTGHFSLRMLDAAQRFAADNGIQTEPLISQQFVDALNGKVIAQAKAGKQEDSQLKKAIELVQAKIKP